MKKRKRNYGRGTCIVERIRKAPELWNNPRLLWELLFAEGFYKTKNSKCDTMKSLDKYLDDLKAESPIRC